MRQGSLQNLMAAQSVQAVTPDLPEVGTPCTIVMWTDRYACEVVEVKPGKRPVVMIRHYDTRVASGSGHDGSAKYEFVSNPGGRLTKVTYRKGRQGYPCWQTEGGSVVMMGVASEYRDPHF